MHLSLDSYLKYFILLYFMRVKFHKGEQREFLDLVVSRLNCISLRGILQFGFNISYNSLKNYYIERRLISGDFFEDLCHISKLNPKNFDVNYLDDNWGRVKGGKKSRRKSREKSGRKGRGEVLLSK